MSWLADNATGIYILLAVVAAGFVAAWRFSGRNKHLGYAAGVLAFLALVWIILKFAPPSDAQQIEQNAQAMADAVVAGRPDDLFKHVSKDFRYDTMTRDDLYAAAQREIKEKRVSDVHISRFRVEEIARATKSATVRFLVTVRLREPETTYMFMTKAEFGLEGDAWKLKTMRFYPPIGNQDREIKLPGIGR